MPGRMVNNPYDMEEVGADGRRPSLLLLATLAVVALYGGVIVWLFFSDTRLAGQPVTQLTLEAEDLVALQSEQLLRGGETQDGTANANVPATPPDEISDDEQSLLDAAQKLGGNAGGVRIIGAESVNKAADGTAPSHQSVAGLRSVPDPALIIRGKNGPLPTIAPDGRKPWQVYARPLPDKLPNKPRIAIVVSGLGISESATQHAIDALPPEVTLSFAPYGANLQSWINKARAAGHEVLLELPMEPFGYPQNDPGPYTLLTSLKEGENMLRLDWLMSRFTGYAGVMNYQGARFTSAANALAPILRDLQMRGLMYVDNGASQRSLAPKLAGEMELPVALGSRRVDPVQSPDVIAQSLAALEASAKQKSGAVGIASGFPVTVDEVARWARDAASKGIVLVPVTAMASTSGKSE